VLAGVHVDIVTGVTGSLLALAGLGWALSAPRLGAPDIADVLPARLRAFLLVGYRLDAVQDRLVVRPAAALARVVGARDRDVLDAAARGTVALARLAGTGARRAQDGLATGYVVWAVFGGVLLGLAGAVWG
jgi:NADH-quinone oxidoreductase subunit L